jgi:hypothetical protein
MNASPDEKQKASWLFPALAFCLLFFLFGAFGFVSSVMDTRGFDRPDYASSWGFFFLFGIPGGFLGLLIRPIVRWWREPHEKAK